MKAKIFDVTSYSDKETFELGRMIGEKCNGGEIIALSGDLGAGKTQFVKGLAKGLNIERHITSPTYVISQVYTNGRLPFVHYDLYRVSDFIEIEEMGWDDFLSEGYVIAVEWAEKIKNIIEREKNVLWVYISIVGDNKRSIKIAAASDELLDLFFK